MNSEIFDIHFALEKSVIDKLDNQKLQESIILAGDVGHTKTLLGLFKLQSDGWYTIHARIYETETITSFEDTLQDFIAEQQWEVSAACFGVAGPVIEERCKPTELNWEVSVASLRSLLKTPYVTLANDLVALGYSLNWLRPQDLLTVQKGKERSGNRVILAAGTGLGECTLFWDGAIHHPSPTEGGHSDFAPQSEWEVGLWRFLSQRYKGHVSVMRVVSGHGINNMFKYVVSTGITPAPEVLAAREQAADIAPIIAQAGIEGSCPASVEVMNHFPRLYGAEAGNLTLKNLAIGGVYLGGGVAPKIIDSLTDGRFLNSFLSKGRFRWLLEEIPINIILEPKAHLLGALWRATSLLTVSS
ncbi:glucokinase [Nostoc sp.]|uniref:glucokinase n=1 Tax=Nostoc sp. TaxID=1180 RepID=UPI002FF5D039